jgi:addiction module HigA family antidote
MASRQYNPPHPGEVLWGLDMEPAGLTVTAVAERIGVDRKTISRIVNGRASITAEMAILLAKAFGTTPELWLNMQRTYDLWHASKAMERKAKKIKPFQSEGAALSPVFP